MACQHEDHPQVFLSYNWGTQPKVKLLKEMLEAEGLTCWMDIGVMGGGDALFAEIDDGISYAQVVVSCLTDPYTKSRNCNKEMSLADLRQKPIIPVLLEQISWPPQGPMAMIFAQSLYIDFTRGEGDIPKKEFNQLLNQIKKYLNDKESDTEDEADDEVEKKEPEPSDGLCIDVPCLTKIKEVSHTVKLQGLTYMAVMAMSPEDNIIVVSGEYPAQRSLHVFDKNGKQLQEAPLEGSEEQYVLDIAAGKDYIYVCTERKCKLYDYKLKFVTILDTPPERRVRSVCVNRLTEEVFILARKFVMVFSKGCSLVRKFIVQEGDKITLSPNGDLLIFDSLNYDKYAEPIVNQRTNEGVKVKTNILEALEGKTIRRVLRLICDKDGSFLAVVDIDKKRLAQVYDADGEATHEIILNGSGNFCSGIGISSDGEIILGSRTRKVFFMK